MASRMARALAAPPCAVLSPQGLHLIPPLAGSGGQETRARVRAQARKSRGKSATAKRALRRQREQPTEHGWGLSSQAQELSSGSREEAPFAPGRAPGAPPVLEGTSGTTFSTLPARLEDELVPAEQSGDGPGSTRGGTFDATSEVFALGAATSRRARDLVALGLSGMEASRGERLRGISDAEEGEFLRQAGRQDAEAEQWEKEVPWEGALQPGEAAGGKGWGTALDSEEGDEHDEHDDEEAEEVELWEGDLESMSAEEEAALLREAEAEIAALEREQQEGRGPGGRMLEPAEAQDLAAALGLQGSPDLKSSWHEIEAEEASQPGGSEGAEDVDALKAEVDSLVALLEHKKEQLRRASRAAPGVPVAGRSSREMQGVLDEGSDGRGALEAAAAASQEWPDEDALSVELDGSEPHALRQKKRLQRLRERLLEGEAGDEERPEGEGGAKERGLPAVMRCFDTAKIYVKAGDGGEGVVAFRREKFVPHGGPSGGNGGRGGNVFLVADRSLNSLLPFRRSVHFRAMRGSHGKGSNRHGEAGEDVEIAVPLGTIVREIQGAGPTLQPLTGPARDEAAAWAGAEEGPDPFCGPGVGAPELGRERDGILVEIVRPGQRELLLAGGRGGRGNAAFKTGRNNAPQLAEHGETGPEMWVHLELKLVADVGIVGAPNAGKSTLLSVISAAKPKVADYPFTTLVPNLGVVPLHPEGAPRGESFGKSLVFADVPGLLEGAHRGAGLGHEFLRHTERCSVLVHVVDGSGPQPEHELEAITAELQLFSPALASKPKVIVFNKMDLPEAQRRWPRFEAAVRGAQGANGGEVLCMSAATGAGVWEVVAAAAKLLERAAEGESRGTDDGWGSEEEGGQWADARKVRRKGSVAALVQQARRAALTEFEIEVDSHTRTFFVTGEGLLRFLQMTNWEYFEAARRFGHVLEASGVTEALRQRGIREGDTVVMGEMEFEWKDSDDWTAVVGTGWKRGDRGSHLWPH